MEQEEIDIGQPLQAVTRAYDLLNLKPHLGQEMISKWTIE